MSPLTIKLLTAGGLVGLFYLMKSSSAQAAPPPPPPGPAPQPQPAPIPRGIPDRVNPDVVPVDQFAGVPAHHPRRVRRGWPWY
jgi:hypothetical protein